MLSAISLLEVAMLIDRGRITTKRTAHEWIDAALTIGAIRVAPSDPKVVWVGTGSDGIRSNVIVGRGIYRSDDADDVSQGGGGLGSHKTNRPLTSLGIANALWFRRSTKTQRVSTLARTVWSAGRQIKYFLREANRCKSKTQVRITTSSPASAAPRY